MVRRLPPSSLTVARRGLSREINRRLVLNLIRTRQPLSRADLARLLGTTRGAVSLLVSDLAAEGLVVEGATGESSRGRKPTFLYVDSRRRSIVAVDVRPTRTFVMVTDLLGEPVVGATSLPTPADPEAAIRAIADRVRQTLATHPDLPHCDGVGVVVPGMVDRAGDRIVYSPRLDWREVAFREGLARRTGLPVFVENSGRACALAHVWSQPGREAGDDIAYVSVSDGVGVGIVVNGEVLRGRHNVGGEFGHTPLAVDGPICACGASGCFEAYVSNLATLSRYFGREISPRAPLPADVVAFTMEDLIARARGGDGRADAALRATARFLGIGLAGLVSAYDPDRILVSGEIVAAWDLLEPIVRAAMAERLLAPVSPDLVDLVPVPASAAPRLRGAAALVAAPLFAAPPMR